MAPRKPKTVKAEVREVAVIEVDTLPMAQERESASVEGFIEKGIMQNVPVETLEKLLAMRSQLKAEHAKEAFIAAMSKFQAECPVISKDKDVNDKHGKYRYSYAPMDSIVSQIKEPLGRNGFSYTVDTTNKDGLLTAVCKITHILGHSETSTFEVPIDKDSYMSAPQKYAAASTFAKRYAFQNALGILTGDQDTDAADLPGGVNAPEEQKQAAKPLEDSNPALATYKKQLEACRTLEELGTAWANLPIQAKNALKGLKDELKAMITNETQVVPDAQ